MSSVRPSNSGCTWIIDHIHNNRHVGFDIIMQISHVVCQGANIKMIDSKT